MQQAWSKLSLPVPAIESEMIAKDSPLVVVMTKYSSEQREILSLPPKFHFVFMSQVAEVSNKIAKALAPASTYLVEFMGTYFLVTAVIFSGAIGGGGPLAVALMLVAMVFMGGHISGAHYNPAVTFAVFCSGRDQMKVVPAVIYIVVQVFASILAAFICWGLAENVIAFSHSGATVYYTPEIIPGGNGAQAFLAEFLATFTLASVVLAVGTSKKVDGNSFYGLAIGFTVGAFAFAFGAISGGVFNPAVGTGPLLVDAINVGDISQLKWIWLYWLAPMAGGFVASIVYRVTHYHADYHEPEYKDMDTAPY